MNICPSSNIISYDSNIYLSDVKLLLISDQLSNHLYSYPNNFTKYVVDTTNRLRNKHFQYLSSILMKCEEKCNWIDVIACRHEREVKVNQAKKEVLMRRRAKTLHVYMQGRNEKDVLVPLVESIIPMTIHQ